MAVLVDIVCSNESCNKTKVDVSSDLIGQFCICGGTWERLWTLTPAPAPGQNSDEKCVVYVSERENKVQYPGRNDQPMPSRLQRRGYERVEVPVSQMGSFEKKHGVFNERRHYDRNGRYD